MLSWLSLVGAVLAFGSASLLQAYGARGSQDSREGVQFVADLARSKCYTAGTVLDLVAVMLTAYALRDLPLFLVQAATASSLAVTALGSALLFPLERQPGIWRPVIAVSLGIALLGSAAAEGESTSVGSGGVLLLALGVALLLGARVVSATISVPPNIRYAVLAGLSYAGMGISLRALHVSDGVLATVTQPVALIAATYLAMALFFFGRSLQQGSVTEAMAIVVSIDTILPAGIGVWLLGDRTRPGWGPAALAGLAVTVAGVLWLVRLTTEQRAGAPVAIAVSTPA